MKLPRCNCHGTPTGTELDDPSNVELAITRVPRTCYHKLNDIVIVRPDDVVSPSARSALSAIAVAIALTILV